MVLYKCDFCNFSSKQKNDYFRHLNTKKHLNNLKELGNEKKKTYILPPKTTKNHQKLTNLPPKTTKNHQKRPAILHNLCKFCEKSFSRKDVLKKHINSNCQVRKKQLNEEYLILKLEEKNKEVEESKLEKEKLYKYIDKLIDKTGDTNINIEKQMNNTINLKNFGDEDTSHITDDYKLRMLSLPYGMIQNMIEKVHFNKIKPENKNIALTNKRDNMIKIFRGKKWKYQDRSFVVDELIKNNYYRLDDFFEEEGKEKMSDTHNQRYLQFQKKFDRQDNELIDRIKKETEMLILSDNL